MGLDGMESVLACVIAELSLNASLIAAGQPNIHSSVVHLQVC